MNILLTELKCPSSGNGHFVEMAVEERCVRARCPGNHVTSGDRNETAHPPSLSCAQRSMGKRPCTRPRALRRAARTKRAVPSRAKFVPPISGSSFLRLAGIRWRKRRNGCNAAPVAACVAHTTLTRGLASPAGRRRIDGYRGILIGLGSEGPDGL